MQYFILFVVLGLFLPSLDPGPAGAIRRSLLSSTDNDIRNLVREISKGKPYSTWRVLSPSQGEKGSETYTMKWHCIKVFTIHARTARC